MWWICWGGGGGGAQQYVGQVGAHIGAVQLYPQGMAPLFSAKKKTWDASVTIILSTKFNITKSHVKFNLINSRAKSFTLRRFDGF